MSRAAVFETRTASLSDDFGMTFALRHFTPEQVAQLPTYTRGPKAGKVKGRIVWVKCTEGGFVYSSPLSSVVPDRYVENRPGKTVAYALTTAEFRDADKIIAATYQQTDFQKAHG